MKILLVLLTLTLVLSVRAQQKFYEEPIGWRGKSIELHTISDGAKVLNCLFLCNDDSIRVFVVDNKETVVQHFYINRLKEEQFLGGFIKEGKVYAFLQASAGISDLHVWILDIGQGIGDDYTVPFAMRHERAVEQISCGDHFLYFAVNKKASQFAIYDFRENKACDTLRYQFEDGIWKALTSYNGGLSREMSVVKVDPDEKMNPDMAHIPNKLYWMRDTLFLLMNNYEKGVTAVFSFDMRAKKVDFRKIVHNNAQKMDPPLEDYVDNSMLLDGKLYFVSAEDNKINVQIRDFYRGSLLKEFSAGRDEEINFKNTPIIQEGSYYHRGPRELAKTRQFLRKMVSGSAVLMASREDSGRVGLTIGAWQKMQTSGGFGMGPMTPGMPVFTSPGVFFRSTNVRSSRFKMLVDSVTLQHVPGEITTDIGDRIEQYTNGISIPPEGENLFKNGGKYVYAYYSRDEHKIMLTSF
ncbi:MAG TPA: hypothetical protein VNU72_11920 [Puia sp.]|jgi:hypothetical protein|nr:hypothetical protein [Puia sp.]